MEQEIAKYFWSLKDSVFYDFFSIISGKYYIFLSTLLFVIYAFISLKRKALLFILIAALALAASDVICYRLLKPAFKRPRPAVELNLKGTRDNINKNKPHINNYSMPSNHASNSFAFFIVYLCCVKKFWSFVFLNSILISVSRIFIVKHYPTDVFVGIALGIIIGLGVLYIFSIFGFKMSSLEKDKKN